jgi:hypothetical protein
VRRGCISLGNIKCDECHRIIIYPERYLFTNEFKDKNITLCMDCCQKKGYVKPGSAKEDADILFDLSTE